MRRQLDLHAQTLQQRNDRFGALPQVMALGPDLRTKPEILELRAQVHF